MSWKCHTNSEFVNKLLTWINNYKYKNYYKKNNRKSHILTTSDNRRPFLKNTSMRCTAVAQRKFQSAEFQTEQINWEIVMRFWLQNSEKS